MKYRIIHMASSFSESELQIIKTKIESMTKEQHIEILNIIKTSSSVSINENKSGVFINLSYLEPEVLDSIKKYMDYVSDQESILVPFEKMKTNLLNDNMKPNDHDSNDEFVTVYR